MRRETGKRWTVEVRHGEGVANRTGPEGVVTLLFEERERTTLYGFSSRRDGLTPCGHRRGA